MWSDEGLGLPGDEARRLLDLLPDALLVVDANRRLLFANRQAETLLGYTRDELAGRSLDDLIPATVRERHQAHVRDFFETGGTRRMGSALDLHVQQKTGRLLPVDVSLASVTTGREPVVLAVLRDASTWAEVKEALRVSEAKYRLLVENASEIFYEVVMGEDPMRGAVRFVSHGCEAITGHPPEDFLNRQELWIECVHPDDRQMLFESTTSILRSRLPGARLYRIRNAVTGEYGFVEDRVIPRLDASGTLVGYQGVARDVTARIRVEEERLRLEARLQQAQKLEAMGRLAGGIAHDFNNILMVVQGHAAAALESLDSGSAAAQELRGIADASRRAVELTRQLLSFARLQPAAPRNVDVNEHLLGIQDLLRRAAGLRPKLAFHLAEGAWRTRIDPSQIDQIVINLVVNAADAAHGDDDLTITVSTRNVTVSPVRATELGCAPGSYVAIVVSDTGVGMDAATLSQVFEPFFTTKAAGKGTGLGLATIDGIVRQNQGGLEMVSEPGRGTTVTVCLPALVPSTHSRH